MKWDANKSLRLLFLTRPDEDLKRTLEAVNLTRHYKPVDYDEIDSDISEFVEEKLGSDPRLSTWPGKKKSEILNKLTEGSNGM